MKITQDKSAAMDLNNDIIGGWVINDEQPHNIMVIGVGGGGGNAVTHMYNEGIQEVTFMLCNTDKQALNRSAVPLKVQLGDGGGAGNDPEKGKKLAEENIGEIRKMLGSHAKMVFITAGMGGGTGTGVAPVIAREAKGMGLLTVGIVTTPFAFEKKRRFQQAKKSIEEMSEYVDALLVINNERLRHIYAKLSMKEAFKKADDILTNAAKSIVELERIPGYINVDYNDVDTVLKAGGTAIIGSGFGSGENRIAAAIKDALTSPLLNNSDIYKAKKMLINIYCSESYTAMEELDEVDNFMKKFKTEDIEFKYGIAFDENLGENVKITILATGFTTNDVLEPAIIKSQVEQPGNPAIKERFKEWIKRIIDNIDSEEKVENTQKIGNYG
jgi:cell division protein FtsZ